MKNMFLDIETYSENPIKNGVRKYVDTDSFRILLLSYAVDDGEVQLIDLTKEELPQDVRAMLTNPDYCKRAFNANFEMTCIGHVWPELIIEEQWSCDQALSTYNSLPPSLAGVGVALKLPQDKKKDTRGKALIKYFCNPCKPTKTNGERTRNLPEHDPEKWTEFCEYNKQDVVTERAVFDALKDNQPPKAEHDLWLLDRHINERGIRIDTQLAANAIKMSDTLTERGMKRLSDITGLDNPNSVTKLRERLKYLDCPMPSLSKDVVMEKLADPSLNDVAREVLQLRLALSKSSVKKYQAMMDTVTNDGRAHNLFQFYGASHTGRWCLTGDHEILTPTGWVRLDEWDGGEIACWTAKTEYLSFKKAKPLVFDYTGEMIHLASKRCDQICTPDHKMPYLDKQGFWNFAEMGNLVEAKKTFTIPFTGRRQLDPSIEHLPLRVLIMTQADGHYTNEAVRFHFSKSRKIERCKMLLCKAKITFTEEKHGDETTCIVVKNRFQPVWLRAFREKVFDWWMLDESPDVFFDELAYWDGYKCGPHSVQYTSTVKKNADIVQAMAVLSGRYAIIIKKHEDVEKWSTAYVVNIWLTPGRGQIIKRDFISRESYSGKVYCAETKTGYFLVRRNGKVWITGNSGRNVQLQNLPRNYIEDLDDARKIVKSGDLEMLGMFYENPMDIISQLIRTALIPAKGNKFIVADFSAIEARVIAWLSGEKWRMEAFAQGKDIYCESASQMFHCNVVKHGENGHLRQKGKIAELALGYGGGVGALKAMDTSHSIDEGEMQDIVYRWRDASPRIPMLWKQLESVAMACIKRYQSGMRDIRTKNLTAIQGVSFEMTNDGNLLLHLPSGRSLSYREAHIGENRFGGESIVYLGANQVTRDWDDVETYGGKLTENLVQAVARDCLAEAMTRLEAAGYRIVAHIHDEVVLDVPNTSQYTLADAIRIMTQNEPWNEGLIMNADGFEGAYYKKD